MTERRSRMRPVVVAAVAATAVAGLGGLMTDLGPWYVQLVKPSWQPPDWLFGPAWTVIFALTALAGLIGWERAPSRRQREALLVALAANAFFNLLWSLLFFRLHRPDWALVEVVVLWVSVLAVALVLWPISRKAAAYLLPYLAWVAFAGVLNLTIVRLNGPFGG